MPVWVSLLRGVNVGSHNRLNMPALRTALSDAGFSDVRTYVQSGNVVARSSHRRPEAVAAAVRTVLDEQFGLDVGVIARSPEQLQAVLDWCPFPEAGTAPTSVHVLHLAAAPAPERVAALLAENWEPDAVAARGTELVIRYGRSMHDSRLQHAPVLKRLGVDGTARNWRTVHALVELSRSG